MITCQNKKNNMTPLIYIIANHDKCVAYANGYYNVSEGEDIVQDVALSYIEKGEEHYKGISDPEAYVRSSIRRKCLQRLRDAQHRALLRAANDELLRGTYGYNKVVPDPLEEVVAMEYAEEIMAGLSALEWAVYKSVLVDFKTYEETAAELGMREQSVRKHVSRIKRKFKNGN